MLNAIESELYRISVSDDYDNSCDSDVTITVKGTNQNITIFYNELYELISILEKAEELF